MEGEKNICKESVFKRLFLELQDGLCNFLYYKSGNREQARDLTQEAFLRLWKACAKVIPSKAKSFLFTTANNLFLDGVKHQKVVLEFAKKPQNTEKVETPEFAYEKTEFHQSLEKAIAALPEKSRVVFLMNRVEQYTYNEIAALLGVSRKTVEKRMQKALIELRKLHKNI